MASSGFRSGFRAAARDGRARWNVHAAPLRWKSPARFSRWNPVAITVIFTCVAHRLRSCTTPKLICTSSFCAASRISVQVLRSLHAGPGGWSR